MDNLLRLFTMTREVKLCGPSIISELFDWSPPVVHLIDWTQSPQLPLVP